MAPVFTLFVIDWFLLAYLFFAIVLQVTMKFPGSRVSFPIHPHSYFIVVNVFDSECCSGQTLRKMSDELKDDGCIGCLDADLISAISNRYFYETGKI